MTAFSTKDDKALVRESPGIFSFYSIYDEANILFTLPFDTICSLNGEKVIAESKILDGGYVYERVSFKPFEITFDFTIRDKEDMTRGVAGSKLVSGLSKIGFTLDPNQKWKFPQEKIEEMVWNGYGTDEPLIIENSFLNGIGIEQIIIKGISINPQRGTTDVPGTIKAFENTGEDSSTLTIA